MPAPLFDESSILCHMTLSPNIQLLLKLTKTHKLIVKITETIPLLVVEIAAPFLKSMPKFIFMYSMGLNTELPLQIFYIN